MVGERAEERNSEREALSGRERERLSLKQDYMNKRDVEECSHGNRGKEKREGKVLQPRGVRGMDDVRRCPRGQLKGASRMRNKRKQRQKGMKKDKKR